MAKGTLVLLRFPFSFFLLPTYLFGLGHAPALDPIKAFAIGAILHLLLYPASNAFNSYFDRDDGPIGGVANPPRPTRALLRWSLAMTLAGVGAAFVVAPLFGAFCAGYALASTLYSWDRTRLKKRPLLSWVAIGLGQGGGPFIAGAFFAGGGWPPVDLGLCLGFGAAALLLLSGYPLTQLYQHAVDGERGDETLSMVLGTRGTFVLSVTLFSLSTAAFCLYYVFCRASPIKAAALAAAVAPVAAYALRWARLCWRDSAAATHARLTRLDALQALLLSGAFGAAIFLP